MIKNAFTFFTIIKMPEAQEFAKPRFIEMILANKEQ
jgi:hypothetical protein